MRIEIRPTIAADLPQVIHVELPHRIRALSALRGDEVLAIAGIGYRPTGEVIAFLAMKDEMRNYPVALHRLGLAGVEMTRRAGVSQVLAEAQEDNPAAVPWLIRLGFRKADDSDVYVWERGANAE